ncbi:hypothetical protein Barb6XT_02851 [Bacteroidales bacterium Barb6XT]|nr:hypothetical protein Barb6XT_02851 [Bacteroidales bacterium Barb6XT]
MNVTKYKKLVNNTDVFNRIFMIEREAFQEAKGLKSNFKLPPKLNYIGDWAFLQSDINSLDFTQGNSIAVIGKMSLAYTQIGTIDLSEHFALSSLAPYCFAHNPNLHTLKLPGSIVGMAEFPVEATPNLHVIELGWTSRPQLDLIQKYYDELKKGEYVNGALVPFRDKKLQIPFGSFEQYYRRQIDLSRRPFSIDYKYLGGIICRKKTILF